MKCKIGFVNTHKRFVVRDQKLGIQAEKYFGEGPEIFVSYSEADLPFPQQFDMLCTPSTFLELPQDRKREIRQLYLFWVDNFAFDGLDSLVSLQVCQPGAINFEQLLMCDALRYFGVCEICSVGYTDLCVLSQLPLSGVAIALLNVRLPDFVPRQFQFYALGDVPLRDMHNQHAVKLVSDAVARLSLDSELYERFCRFRSINYTREVRGSTGGAVSTLVPVRHAMLRAIFGLRTLLEQLSAAQRTANQLQERVRDLLF